MKESGNLEATQIFCARQFFKFNLKLVNKAMVTVFPMADILFGKVSA